MPLGRRRRRILQDPPRPDDTRGTAHGGGDNEADGFVAGIVGQHAAGAIQGEVGQRSIKRSAVLDQDVYSARSAAPDHFERVHTADVKIAANHEPIVCRPGTVGQFEVIHRPTGLCQSAGDRQRARHRRARVAARHPRHVPPGRARVPRR